MEMSNPEKTINSLQELFNEVKHYVTLQGEYLQLQLVEKLILLLSAIMLTLILFIVGLLLVFNLCLAGAHLLSPLVGGVAAAHLIVGCCILLLGICVYLLRRRLIVNPLTRFLSNLLLNP